MAPPTDSRTLGGARALLEGSVSGVPCDLPRSARRFWGLVLATGVLVGLGSALLLLLLRAVQSVAWPAAPTFLAQVERAGTLRRCSCRRRAACSSARR